MPYGPMGFSVTVEYRCFERNGRTVLRKKPMTDFQCRFIRQEPLEPSAAFELARCKTELFCQLGIAAEDMAFFVAPQQRQRQIADDGVATLGMDSEGF